MNIAVAGAGYVGLAIAILLARKNNVVVVDISVEKINLLSQGKCPFMDELIEEYISQVEFGATTNWERAYQNADYVIIATPTDFDEKTKKFNTSAVEDVISKVFKVNAYATIVIKSTIPVGYTKKISALYNTNRIIFSPEFLREGNALYDCLYPSRIVVGERSARARSFANLLKEGALKENVDVLLTDSTEAEAIKLFANSYLALRVCFFNELDTYCELKGLDAKSIIEGIGLDPRIGKYYNNPSFGYGGYCLPKDSKQLLANYQDIPENLISAIVQSNMTRKQHVADMILRKKPDVIGIYRLTMKANSDNTRESAILDVISILNQHGAKVIVYEPMMSKETSCFSLLNDIDIFKKVCDVIVANRYSDILDDVREKVYTRDIFFQG